MILCGIVCRRATGSYLRAQTCQRALCRQEHVGALLWVLSVSARHKTRETRATLTASLISQCQAAVTAACFFGDRFA
jgi:hypothetical protein